MDSIEDIVKLAMLKQGKIRSLEDSVVIGAVEGVSDIDTDKTTNTELFNPESTGTNDNEQVQALIGEVLIEFLRKQKISFTQLGHVRRIFKRILVYLCTEQDSVTLGSIKNVIDPRFRSFIPLMLVEMTRAGILIENNDDTMKLRWTVTQCYRAAAIMFGMEK